MPPRIRISFRLPRLGPPEGWSRGARVVFLLLFALTLSLAVRSLFGEKGFLEWWRLRAEETRLEQQVATMASHLAAERGVVRDLQAGGVAVERIARESLGMVKPGEVVYLIPEDTAIVSGGVETPGVAAEPVAAP